jgi:hypothetical protein
MYKAVVLAIVLSLTACKKKDENKPAPAPSDKPAAGDTAKPATPAAPAAATKLDCDKILLKAIDGVPQSTIKTVTIGTQVTAYDQDSNCSMNVTGPTGVDAVAFTKDLLAALPPK